MTTYKITYRNMNAVQLAGMTQYIDAEYYKLEDGWWFSFKTADHKVILTVFAEEVRSIERVGPAN